ncbi:MAG: ATP-binding protein [Leptospirales bacterium]
MGRFSKSSAKFTLYCNSAEDLEEDQARQHSCPRGAKTEKELANQDDKVSPPLGSSLFTSNPALSRWSEFFGDSSLTKALPDRPTHHCLSWFFRENLDQEPVSLEEHAFGWKKSSDPAEFKDTSASDPEGEPIKGTLSSFCPVSPWVGTPSGRGSLKTQGFFGVPT